MKYDENIVVTYKCESCNVTNRIVNPQKTGGRWNCGKCGRVVLHRKRIFHETLILDVRLQLELMLSQLREIKYPFFEKRKIQKIEERNRKYKSKIENWTDHVSYLKDIKEQHLIFESYRPDIKEMQKLIILISKETNDTRWIQNKLMSVEFIRVLMVSTASTMTAIAAVFSFFGFDGIVKSISNLFDLKSIVDEHENV